MFTATCRTTNQSPPPFYYSILLQPDNILVSSDFRTIRLCDFGSAFRESDADNDPTPYLVSRFYRAPEITLGLEYNRQIDLWAAANCVYELFTGNVMFPGRDNNHMLQVINGLLVLVDCLDGCLSV